MVVRLGVLALVVVGVGCRFDFDDHNPDALPPGKFSVGGTVTGLTSGGLDLQNNGTDNRTVAGDGAFTFSTPLDDGQAYVVTVVTAPAGEQCVVANSSGTILGASVTDVAVTCFRSERAHR